MCLCDIYYFVPSQILQSKFDRKSSPSPTALDAFSENNKHLQKALIAYLNRRSEKDPACAVSIVELIVSHFMHVSTCACILSPSQYARDFYIGQWLRDSQLELEKALQGPSDASTDLLALDEGEDPEISSSAVALQQAEVKKEMLHSLMDAKTLTKLKLVLVTCLFGESVIKWCM